MGLTKLVTDNAKYFVAGVCAGFITDAVMKGWGSLELKAMTTVADAVIIGTYFNYKHKIFKVEPLPIKETIKKTSAASLGIFTGYCLYSAYECLSKLG